MLTSEQTAIVSTLTANLMGDIIQAAERARASSHIVPRFGMGNAIGNKGADSIFDSLEIK